jgi:hypothetical protein
MITQQVFNLLSSYRDQFHARRTLACLFGRAVFGSFDEAESLQNQNTRDSLPIALKKYEEALTLYRVIEDPTEQFTVFVSDVRTTR